MKCDDDMDDRSDPDKRHCDRDVYDGRCVARVGDVLVVIRKEEDSTVHGNGQAGAGLGANLPYRFSLGSRIHHLQFKKIRLSERDRSFRLKNLLEVGINVRNDSSLTPRERTPLVVPLANSFHS